MATFGSLFSGVGGLDLGLERAGWECKWQVELDEWRRGVLERHWPGVPRYADVRDVGANGLRNGADVCASAPSGPNETVGAVDLICGGFPCQDVSVAGRRAGLAGARSGLFHEFARIADAVRPGLLLIENVPGLLTSNGGRDFGVILGTLADIGYGVAWRILDSRFFGVPQRRRRVFIVGALPSGHLGAERAGEVLAVGTRCERHPASGRAPRKDVASALGFGARSGGAGHRLDLEGSGAYPVTTNLMHLGSGGPDDNDAQAGRIVGVQDVRGMDKAQNGLGVSDGDVAYTLDGIGAQGIARPAVMRWREGKPGGGKGALVREGESLALARSNDQVLFDLAGPLGGGNDGIGRRDEDDPNLVVADPLLASGGKNANSPGFGRDGHIVAHSLTSEGHDASEDGTGRGTPLAYSLRRDSGGTGQGHNTTYPSGVRRLTPVECCRLQGFPDDWLGEPNEPPDSPRYAAMGDAVTVNVAQFIGERLRGAQ